jgi:hypothetical protein
METLKQREQITTSKWWKSKRFDFNINLVVSGSIAFMFNALAMWLPNSYIEHGWIQLTLSTTMFLIIGFFISLGIANIAFTLGPFLEKIIKPKDIDRYRSFTYKIYDSSTQIPLIIAMIIFIFPVSLEIFSFISHQ